MWNPGYYTGWSSQKDDNQSARRKLRRRLNCVAHCMSVQSANEVQMRSQTDRTPFCVCAFECIGRKCFMAMESFLQTIFFSFFSLLNAWIGMFTHPSYTHELRRRVELVHTSDLCVELSHYLADRLHEEQSVLHRTLMNTAICRFGSMKHYKTHVFGQC